MTSPKIGIITFHASHNCGSFMQAYALQRFLHKTGFSNEIINFSNHGQQELYRSIPKINNLKGLIKNIILLPHHQILKQTSIEYVDFIQSNLLLSSQTFTNNSELKKANFPYDTYISGSDQIWNITIDDSDDAYFLNFVKAGKKKIAYAPSFGAKNIAHYADSQNYDKYKKLLLDYDALSIRENNGKKWLKNMLKKDTPVVLDPTLLLDINDYKNIEQPYDEKIKKGSYIFYYSPNYEPKINKLVLKIAKKYHLQIVAWNPKNFYLKGMNFSKFYLPKVQNPGVYLSLIKDAAIVITTSFHGTIFSTIYKKNFWTIKNGGMFENDDRVKTLIEQLHISERLIAMDFQPDFNYLKKTNYSIYDKELPNLRKTSQNYLLGALNDH